MNVNVGFLPLSARCFTDNIEEKKLGEIILVSDSVSRQRFFPRARKSIVTDNSPV